MKGNMPLLEFDRIPELMEFLGSPGGGHAHIALIDHDKDHLVPRQVGVKLFLRFYKISLKDNFTGKVRYGNGHYDFCRGSLAFVGPGQLVELGEDRRSYTGYSLFFDPELLQGHSLARDPGRYEFFSYAITEGLSLSGEEREIVSGIFKAIRIELSGGQDSDSQEVLAAHVQTLLSYGNRFYRRQYSARDWRPSDVVDRVNDYLKAWFEADRSLVKGIPSPQQVAEQLTISQRRLLDTLKSLTGLTIQQHIHQHVIERAKYWLSTSSLTVSEVAYLLGFEHSQSLNKLFKAKTGSTPLEYRLSFE